MWPVQNALAFRQFSEEIKPSNQLKLDFAVWIDLPKKCNFFEQKRRKKQQVYSLMLKKKSIQGQPYLPQHKSEVRRDGIIFKDETTGANLLGFFWSSAESWILTLVDHMSAI